MSSGRPQSTEEIFAYIEYLSGYFNKATFIQFVDRIKALMKVNDFRGSAWLNFFESYFPAGEKERQDFKAKLHEAGNLIGQYTVNPATTEVLSKALSNHLKTIVFPNSGYAYTQELPDQRKKLNGDRWLDFESNALVNNNLFRCSTYHIDRLRREQFNSKKSNMWFYKSIYEHDTILSPYQKKCFARIFSGIVKWLEFENKLSDDTQKRMEKIICQRVFHGKSQFYLWRTLYKNLNDNEREIFREQKFYQSTVTWLLDCESKLQLSFTQEEALDRLYAANPDFDMSPEVSSNFLMKIMTSSDINLSDAQKGIIETYFESVCRRPILQAMPSASTVSPQKRKLEETSQLPTGAPASREENSNDLTPDENLAANLLHDFSKKYLANHQAESEGSKRARIEKLALVAAPNLDDLLEQEARIKRRMNNFLVSLKEDLDKIHTQLHQTRERYSNLKLKLVTYSNTQPQENVSPESILVNVKSADLFEIESDESIAKDVRETLAQIGNERRLLESYQQVNATLETEIAKAGQLKQDEEQNRKALEEAKNRVDRLKRDYQRMFTLPGGKSTAQTIAAESGGLAQVSESNPRVA